MHTGPQGASSPSYVLRAHEGHAQPPFAHSTIAYHGTHLENLHSILHTGLQVGAEGPGRERGRAGEVACCTSYGIPGCRWALVLCMHAWLRGVQVGRVAAVMWDLTGVVGRA